MIPPIQFHDLPQPQCSVCKSERPAEDTGTEIKGDGKQGEREEDGLSDWTWHEEEF